MRSPLLAALALALVSTSCASIVSKSDWPVTIQTNPSGASVKVMDEDGAVVEQGTTPFSMTLDAHEGFFRGEDYTVEAQLSGHAPARLELSSRLNPWYWGNLIFGGFIGFLIVDPATGAMWKYRDTYTITLSPVQN